MKKKIRVWKKQEKRIVTLLYRKGLVKTDLNELYWETYKRMELNQRFYLPEIHFSIGDYWGEHDEFSLVDRAIECLYWEHAEETQEDCDGVWPKSTFKCKGRLWLIRYLEKLPTIINDSKINKVLKTYEL